MDEKYYLTKNDGFTYEEMSLYELGRELLTYDGAEIQIDTEFTLMHRKPIGGGNFGHWDEAQGAYRKVSCHFQFDIFQNQEAYQAVREEGRRNARRAIRIGVCNGGQRRRLVKHS